MVAISARRALQNWRMPTDLEKEAFAKRLRFALNRSPDSVKGATELALRFNLRHRSGAPISPQTAHKWLSGRSIPTNDKIDTLALWLNVSAHWLHYGPEPTQAAAAREKEAKLKAHQYPVSTETLTLSEKIEALAPHQRYLVEELVTQFYGVKPQE
jgi:transcriptional regulator with XRE-family HTH domain